MNDALSSPLDALAAELGIDVIILHRLGVKCDGNIKTWKERDDQGVPINQGMMSNDNRILPRTKGGRGFCYEPFKPFAGSSAAAPIIVADDMTGCAVAMAMGFDAIGVPPGADFDMLAELLADRHAAVTLTDATTARICAKALSRRCKLASLIRLPESVIDLPDLVYHQGVAQAASEFRRMIEAAQIEPPVCKEAVQPREMVTTWEPLPLGSFPGSLTTTVENVASAMQCDPSFVALSMLVVAAGCIGNSREVELQPGWREPSILWGAVIGESGTTKTSAIDFVLRPVHDRDRQLIEAHRDAQTEFEQQQAEYDAEVRKRRSDGGAESRPKPTPPPRERLCISDATLEAVGTILQDSPRGAILFRDELSGWLGSFDRYSRSRGGDAAGWLQLHRAQTLTVDRISRPTIFVPRAAMSIIGGIQPEAFRRALGDEHFENGLAARMLVVHPPRVRRRWQRVGIRAANVALWKRVVDGLLALKPQAIEGGSQVPIAVILSPEAEAIWGEYFDQHADETHELQGHLAAVWSKQEGGAARLALVIHCIRCVLDADGVQPYEIDASSMLAGITLAKWFCQEWRRLFGTFHESDGDRRRRELYEWIVRRGSSVAVRDVYRNLRAYPNEEAARAALKGLEAARLGRFGYAEQTGPGHPSEVFTLNQKPTADADTIQHSARETNIVSVSAQRPGNRGG